MEETSSRSGLWMGGHLPQLVAVIERGERKEQQAKKNQQEEAVDESQGRLVGPAAGCTLDIIQL